MQIYKNTGKYCKLRPKKKKSCGYYSKKGTLLAGAQLSKKKKQKEMSKLTASHAGTRL